MDDQELKDLVAGLAVSQRETDKQIKQLSAETDKQIKQLSAETDKQIKQLGKEVKGLKDYVGNIAHNNGDVAEEFFYNGLESRMELGGIEYQFIDKHFHRRHKNIEAEFDIVLVNSGLITVIETKYKVHPDFVEEFVKEKLPKFKKLFPVYKDYKLRGGIAGLSVPGDSQKKALDYGLYILTQSGKEMKVLNQNLKEY